MFDFGWTLSPRDSDCINTRRTTGKNATFSKFQTLQLFMNHIVPSWINKLINKFVSPSQRVDTIKREMFSQKSVRRFVGDSSAFVMGAMFLASALNRDIHPPEILKNVYQYRGEMLLFRALADNMAPMTNHDECWRITNESPYAFSYLPVSLYSIYSLTKWSLEVNFAFSN